MPVTNQQLQDAINRLTGRVDRIEERMHTYEEQSKENYIILRRVEDTVNGYEKTIHALATLFRWVISIIGIASASVLGYWVLGLLHIRVP